MDVVKVEAVLLADGWHDVQAGTFRAADFSFETGAVVNMVGQGFVFSEPGAHGDVYRGPMRSVLAVRGKS